jgi:hypothetical protein
MHPSGWPNDAGIAVLISVFANALSAERYPQAIRHVADCGLDVEGHGYLYRHERGALLHVAIHSHFGGRSLITAMVHRVLDYLQGFGGVWFARHSEIARLTIDKNTDAAVLTARF